MIRSVLTLVMCFSYPRYPNRPGIEERFEGQSQIPGGREMVGGSEIHLSAIF